MAKVQVTATALGYDGLQLRNPGDVFGIDEKIAAQHSSWFKPVDPKFKVAPQRERGTPGDVSSELDKLKAQVAQLTALLARRSTKTVDGKDPDDLV